MKARNAERKEVEEKERNVPSTSMASSLRGIAKMDLSFGSGHALMTPKIKIKNFRIQL
jgi:hypothetical protein